METFSSYLIDEQIVTDWQLENCISAQTVNDQIIAYHAVKKRFVSAEKLKQLIRRDTPSGKDNLLNACRSNGLLTDEQVYELLRIQSQNHNYLGMSLVKLNFLAMNNLNHHLRKFKKKIFTDQNQFSKVPDADLKEEIVNRHRSFFYNMGYVTELVSIETDVNPDTSHVHYATEMISDGKNSYYVGISLDEEIVLSIAAQKHKAFRMPHRPNELYEVFAQILFNLNYSICKKIKNIGWDLRHGPVQYRLPDYSRCSTARCKVLDGYVDIRIMS